MRPYIHKVAYYETDKMAITHHSNYIRWMEEARVDFLDQIGWGFKKLEESGIASPVLAVSGNYKKSTVFDDKVEIAVKVQSFTGIRLTIAYEMRIQGESDLCFTGTSEHCFLNTQGRPVRLQKDFPGFYQALMEHSSAEASQ